MFAVPVLCFPPVFRSILLCVLLSLLWFVIQPFALQCSLQLQMPWAVPRLCSLTLATFFSCSLSSFFLKLVHLLEALPEGVKAQEVSLA